MTLRTLARRRIWAYSLSTLRGGGGIRDEKTLKLSRNMNQFVAQITPALYFLQHYSFLQIATNVFVARQVDHARWKTRNIEPKLEHAAMHCCTRSWGFLYLVFRRLKRNRNQNESLFWSYPIRSYLRCFSIKLHEETCNSRRYSIYFTFDQITYKRRTRLEISSVAPLR